MNKIIDAIYSKRDTWSNNTLNEITKLKTKLYTLEHGLINKDERIILDINFYRGVGGSTCNSMFKHLNMFLVINNHKMKCYDEYDFSFDRIGEIVNNIQIDMFTFRDNWKFKGKGDFLEYVKMIDKSKIYIDPKEYLID